MAHTEREQECPEHWVLVPDNYQPDQGECLVEVHLICDEKPKHSIVPGLTPGWLANLKLALQYAEQTFQMANKAIDAELQAIKATAGQMDNPEPHTIEREVI